MPNIKGPDGKIIAFPDGTSDADIAAAFSQTPTPPVDMSNVAGAGPSGPPQPANFSKTPAATSVLQPPTASTLTSNLLKTGEGYKGALKSIPATAAGITRLDPRMGDVTTALDRASQINNPEQDFGKTVGDAAQFLIPGAGEERAALFGASKLPMLGRAAAPVAKLGAQALGTGALNAAQGGSFGGGAAAGVAGGLFGMGLQKVAPALAETALGVRAADRAYGRTPGQAILSETTGVKPGSIANQATEKVGQLNNELQSAAAASPMTASLAPARQVVDDAYNSALLENEDQTIKGIGKLQNQLQQWSGQPGAANIAPIPQNVTPSQLLSLKRGVGSFKGSFNPATTPEPVGAAAGRAYHALDAELDRTVPEAAGLNQRMSTLMPVAQRAGATDLNAGVLQRVIGRAARPTGALAGAGIGGAAGYKENGWEGAGIGAGLGLFAPEILTNPKTLMGEARLFNSPAAQTGTKALTGAGLQASRKLFPQR